ncbi:acyltransferase [Williamsia sp. CHRR-6]|uniref:acyltransferase family protein n=1 Tax=Williamsia sp. CHRR-6 TaxID=2835871 RepID=UPI001BD9A27D|nr:acyltransferase [Williamsia sp. CHRR-6]MBT0567377.1 acyltransferase [Williamsia sp. CHRR-6]
MSAPRNPALTGIRAVAALLVCATHAAFWTGRYTDDLPGRFFARLEVGVPIFFVLSGLLLFGPWVRSLADNRPPPSVGHYARQRIRRILPAYVVTVLVVYAIFAWWRTDTSTLGHGLDGLLRHLTLTQIYGFGHLHSGLTQMWSLSVEVAFYVCLPPLAWLLTRVACAGRWRPGALLLGLTALAAISPIWAVLTHSGNRIDPTAGLWPPGFASWFAGGMALAVVAEISTRRMATGGSGLRCLPILSVPVAVLAFQLSCTDVAGEPTITPATAGATIVKHALYLVVALGLIAPLVLEPRDTWWHRTLSWRPLVWLGEISYEFFLVHLMVLELMMDVLGYRVFTGSTTAAFVATTAFSIPIAWLLHRLTWWSARHEPNSRTRQSVPSKT